MFLFNFLYNLLFLLAYPFIFFVFIIRALFDKDIRLGHLYRLGLKRPPFMNGKNVWIHAPAMGEVLSIKELIAEFIDSGYGVYLSTTTHGGYEIANKMYKDNVVVFYNSLDLSILVNTLIKIISPSYMLIVEVEIWPTLLYQIHKRNIPLYLINGRIGERELKAYGGKLAKLFFKGHYKLYTKILAKGDFDKNNMITIGMPEKSIIVTGNLKYDTKHDLKDYKINEIKSLIPDDKYIIVLGSSHDGEEELLLKAIGDAGIKNKSFVVIVPRYTSRASNVKNIAKKHGYNLALYSKDEKQTGDGIIVDVIGELLYWYKHSNIAVMGGSFSKNVRGHNILEPIYFAKPVIVGPYMSNFEDMFLYMKDSLFPTSCEAESVSSILRNCYSNTEIANVIGESAYNLFVEKQGATQKTMEIIKSSLIF